MVERTDGAERRDAGGRRLVTILGATGSVGRSTCAVIREKPEIFAVDSVIGGSDTQALAKLAVEVGARHAAVADENGYQALKSALSGTGISVGAGAVAVNEAATRPVDRLVAAITGIAGLGPTYAAAKAGQIIALANKETLVSAGDMFMRAAADAGAIILPLDSEHNALFQALGANPVSTIETMIITASGGPFRKSGLAEIAAATRSEALSHPNWSMGPKVTIDSATMMNKGLELIEAYHLFGLPASRLEVLVHPQSIIHGLISFHDGSITAGLAQPDMRIPVAHCLGWPERLAVETPRLNLATVATLTFEQADRTRFPALALAEQALKAGGSMPTILNGANEVAVAAFLAGQLSFMGIAALVETTLEKAVRRIGATAPRTLEDVNEINHVARAIATEDLSSGRSRAIR